MEGGLRRRKRARRVVGLSSAGALLGSLLFASAAVQDAGQPVDFARDVRPILDARCISCHGPKKQKGDYRVDTYERTMAGTSSGKSIIPGSPGASDFYRRLVTSEADERMPQKEDPLSPREIEVLRHWIEQGARAAAPPVSSHWAFVPPVEPEAPAVSDRAWIRNPIDRFVLAKLEASGKKPEPEAPKADLLRRLRLDLTGVAATAEEIESFEKDPDPGRYDREVDRLLATRECAERLARWWAEVVGAPTDERYRGWLVEAFERDLAFDAFTIEQIADGRLPREVSEKRLEEIWLGVPLAALSASPPKDRAELARRIVSPENPLTARVAANRVWALLLGRGIVPSLDDFGEHGDPPSNREVLDWLALDFAGNGWSVKHLAGRIVRSATYRQR